eukprot:COSAG02_NODE_5382_length_4380_cov_682.327082_1_plen_638_part_00
MGKPSAAALAVLDAEAADDAEGSDYDEYSDASQSNRSDDDVDDGGDAMIGDDGPTEEQVVMMFNVLDADGSGTLSRAEIAVLAKELGQEMSEEALDAAVREMDADADGGIDLPEFKLWFIKQFGITGCEDEEMPVYDVRERIEKIYTVRLRPEDAEQKLGDLDELMGQWAGREATLLRHVEEKYAVVPGSELTDETIKMTKKALVARSQRVRARQSALPPKELSMRVANDKVRYRIVNSDDIERKKQQELEAQLNFYKTIMANRIQIEWRMSVKRHVRHRVVATTAIAAAYRGWRVRSRMLSHLAAIFIQRQWRRYSTRRHAVLLELYEIAVRYIQRRVRWRQARHRARKTLLAKHAVRACWERQQRRSKEIKAIKREQAKARESIRKELFAKTMEEVLGYAAAQRAKEEAIQAAKEAEIQKQREKQARQLIRKHVIQYIMRRRLRAKVKIRRGNDVADMQALLFGSIGDLLGAHPEESMGLPGNAPGDAPATTADAAAESGSARAAAPDQAKVASGTSAASGHWKRKSRRLKAVTSLRGLRAQAVMPGELSAAANSQAETVTTTAAAQGLASEQAKAQRQGQPSGVTGLLALPSAPVERSRRAKRKSKAGLSAMVRMHRSGALAKRATPDRLVPLT